jgi:hypothetical protein
MPWLGVGTGATAKGVMAGVGGLPSEGDSGYSGSDTSGACEGEPEDNRVPKVVPAGKCVAIGKCVVGTAAAGKAPKSATVGGEGISGQAGQENRSKMLPW